MKKGDVVTITDGSFTRSVVDGELRKESLNYGEEKDKHYTIIETNCVFPNTGSTDLSWPCYQPATHNNTVIQAVETGKVVFIEERFLRLATRKITIPSVGTVHLSYKECENLKEQLV